MTTADCTDIAIHVRDRRFGRDEVQKRWWVGGDPVATAFYNVLSSVFPYGEAFFIETLRKYRGEVPADLAAQIIAFTMQETLHTREHVAFNRRVKEAGYDIGLMEETVKQRLALIRSKPPIASLAATIALEHFTAIIAHQVLADPRHLAAADDETAAMWRWHAMEEIEHKGVAYDTWLHATRDWTPFKRWKIRSKVMLLVARSFVVDRTNGVLELLRQDGITGVRAWAGMLWFWFGNPGIMRHIARHLIAFFKPGFHPWDRDDAYLVARYEEVIGQGEEAVKGIPPAPNRIRRAA